MSARDELAKVIESGYGEDPTDCPYDHAPIIADALLAAGYRKPEVIAYVVVARDGQLIGKQQFKGYAAAKALADVWTADCQTEGVDWDYRVAEITEAAK
jgi:hypothetical protein